MGEKKEEKEVKVNLSFTPEKLFFYGAIVDAVLGVIWAICAVANGGWGVYGGGEERTGLRDSLRAFSSQCLAVSSFTGFL
jgi:hypothetical protein